jgi:putative serine protease PepD
MAPREERQPSSSPLVRPPSAELGFSSCRRGRSLSRSTPRFAIPVDFANRIADELIAEGRVTRPNLGLQVQAIPEELARRTGGSAGLFVQSVTSGGAAANAGLRPGDVIVEVDGEPARDVDALIVKTLTMKSGDTLRVKYERHGSSHTTVVTLTP